MNNKLTSKVPNFWDYQISCKLASELSQEALTAIQQQRHIVFACANPHSLNVANKDPLFRQALLKSDVLVADGIGLTTTAKLLGRGPFPRVTGTDYFTGVMQILNDSMGTLDRKGRVFFFGSTQKVLDLIASRMQEAYPNLELVGMISPPFGDWSNEIELEMINKINAAKADVLWVGMTAPKQEKWAEKNRHALNTPIVGSIGAVFDFFAGTYPRAPRWACAMGVEWLIRLLREPRRMWRRTIISMPLFAVHTMKYYLLASSTKTDATNR